MCIYNWSMRVFLDDRRVPPDDSWVLVATPAEAIALLETGEVPTTRGQTHGPRGIHGHTEQFLFREKTNLPDPQVAPAYSPAA